MKAYKYNGLTYPGAHQNNILSKLHMYLINTLVGMYLFYFISLEPHFIHISTTIITQKHSNL